MICVSSWETKEGRGENTPLLKDDECLCDSPETPQVAWEAQLPPQDHPPSVDRHSMTCPTFSMILTA